MKRLNIGDIVKAKHPNSNKYYIGIISAISMFNNDSIDNCDYSIIFDITEEQVERAKNSQILPTAVYLENGAAWFRRQDVFLLEESRLKYFIKEK